MQASVRAHGPSSLRGDLSASFLWLLEAWTASDFSVSGAQDVHGSWPPRYLLDERLVPDSELSLQVTSVTPASACMVGPACWTRTENPPSTASALKASQASYAMRLREVPALGHACCFPLAPSCSPGCWAELLLKWTLVPSTPPVAHQLFPGSSQATWEAGCFLHLG